MSRLVSFAISIQLSTAAPELEAKLWPQVTPPQSPGRQWLSRRVPTGSVRCRRPPQQAVGVIGEYGLTGQFLPARFELALHHPQFGEHRIPLRLQPAHLFIRQLAHGADRNTALQDIHRLARELRQHTELAQNVFGLLQKIRPQFGELALLLARNDRLRLVQAVGDQIVQLLPILQLQLEQPQFFFHLAVSHRRDQLPASSSVSSNFCRLSIKRYGQGRSTVCTWLMMPSSK